MIIHQSLIAQLPTKELRELDYECQQLRGKLWGKYKMYVFDYPPVCLFFYHYLVMQRLQDKGVNMENWIWANYRGKDMYRFTTKQLYWTDVPEQINAITQRYHYSNPGTIYKEHNQFHLEASIVYLSEKNIKIERGMIL